MATKRCDLSKVERKYKMGDIHPETGMIFGHYTGYNKSGEQWYTPETYSKRMVRLKNYRETDKFKEYSKSWYRKNKDRISENRASYYKNKKQISPLSFIYRNTLQSLKSRKKKDKNIEFDITREYLNDLWEKQDGKCYYTGIDMVIVKEGKHPQHPSLDRIDSEKGYTKDNVVLCCQSINFAKHSYKIEDFLSFLKLIKSV